jgi:ketosteroid isomerase-like protein
MSDASEAASVIDALVMAVNSGDFATALTSFTEAPVIIEDLPPYRWSGSSAPSEWLNAMGTNAASLGVTSVVMETQEPSRVELQGDRAYIIVPGHLRLETGGPPLTADGMLTFTLEKAESRWLIDTLVWSGPRPS